MNMFAPNSAPARIAALAIALITSATLLLRVYLSTIELGSIGAAIEQLTQFFTILTNALVLLAMSVLASGKSLPQRWLLAVTVAITAVGIIYHAVLAQLWDPQGLVLLADHGVHTYVPVLAALWWLLFANKNDLEWRAALSVIIWPLIYCAYALARAEFSGFYPYPFIDLEALGWQALLVNIAGLTAGFLALGFGAIGAAKLIASRA